MATAYITEYRRTIAIGGMSAAHAPAVAEQTIAIGGASTPSAAFNNATRLIRVHVDAICSIEIATSPTASATTARMAANTTEYFGVNPGDKIAVITNS